MFHFNQRHSGYYFDNETQTFYAYLRDQYDPLIGRFRQFDPVGLRGGINGYSYVGNRPLNYTDPRGLCPICAALFVFLAENGSELAFATELAALIATDTPSGASAAAGTAENAIKAGAQCAAESGAQLPARLYHYTGEGNVGSILEKGLGYDRPLTWTTPAGSLSPVQAQIELALPPNRGYPGALFEIDTARLQQLGIYPAVGPQRIMSTPTAGGGGIEYIFNQPIPPSAIRQVPFP